jgi:hypothetical protein
VVMQGWGAAVQVAQSIQRPSGLHVLVRLASAAGDVPGPGRIVVIRVVVVVGAGGAGAGAALPLGRAVSHGASINKDTGSVCGSNQCSNAAMWIMVLARHRVHVLLVCWANHGAGPMLFAVDGHTRAPRLPQNPPPARAPAPPCLSTWLHLIFTLHLTFTLHSSPDSTPHTRPYYLIHPLVSPLMQSTQPSLLICNLASQATTCKPPPCPSPTPPAHSTASIPFGHSTSASPCP